MIYLASASPRRQELLRQLGIGFEAMPADIPEAPQAGERAEDYVMRVAGEKARHVAQQVRRRGLASHPVLGADTEVVLQDEILGKPRDAQHGGALLHRLAGRTHEVLTGLVLVHQDVEFRTLHRSRVTFGPLTDADIRRYWDSGEPADKAGGYAIQGRAAAFIQRIEGSYSGIVGLPLFELTQLLKQAGLRQA